MIQCNNETTIFAAVINL